MTKLNPFFLKFEHTHTNSNRECIILKFDLYPFIWQIFRDLSIEITSKAVCWVEKQYHITYLHFKTQNNTIYSNGCITVY